MNIITEQMELRPELPVIIGNVDYQEFLRRLERIDEMLELSRLEDMFVLDKLKE